MLKLMGAFLLAGGAAYLGFSATARLERRVRTLRTLLGALELLERELSFRLTPMPALLERLAKQTRPPVSTFFARCLDGLSDLGERTLSDLWSEALESVPMDLGQEDLLILRELGGILGRYDGEGQGEALALAQARLGQCLTAAAEERTRLGRVYGALGLSIGALLVILLL
jgi:stage III sporulation protein AB